MEKKQYIAPETTICLVQTENVMYGASFGVGETEGDAKKSNGFFDFFDEEDQAGAVAPQSKSLWDVDERYDAW